MALGPLSHPSLHVRLSSLYCSLLRSPHGPLPCSLTSCSLPFFSLPSCSLPFFSLPSGSLPSCYMLPTNLSSSLYNFSGCMDYLGFVPLTFLI